MSTRIWRSVSRRTYFTTDSDGNRIYYYKFECGHTTMTDMYFRHGEVVICGDCETPPKGGGKELPRHPCHSTLPQASAIQSDQWSHLSEQISRVLRSLEHIANNAQCLDDYAARMAGEALADDLRSIERNTKLISKKLKAMGSSGVLGGTHGPVDPPENPDSEWAILELRPGRVEA